MKILRKLLSYFSHAALDQPQEQEQWLTPEDIHRMFCRREQQ
ncbi:hypothetical protein TOI97_03020 [Denitrificimonas sp. JX-1]|uniref:Uncharacterized protein n=1 Tax=Denitrificimonas halotolerans TaxID=3098930 RepID=A0ABU5GP82_9GAMM|nr:hypothetical protein [Denitrificimonas sp. JX-1]